MKVAIIGSRNLSPAMERLLEELPAGVSEIVSGGARGIDRVAEALARSQGLALTVHRPDYDRFGRGAPLRRNRTIVQEADMVLAFWDGKSRGTMHAVKEAKKLSKPVRVIQWT
jgi:predicted Rossmann fold nucleotide-binding protein DprA/Smf involved in DNA uptake